MCGSIRYQAKSEQNVRQDLIPRVGHGEAALSTTIVILQHVYQSYIQTLEKVTAVFHIPIDIGCDWIGEC